MVGIGQPVAFLVMRSQAKDRFGWVFEPEPEPELAPPLSNELLSRIKDNMPLPDLRGRLRDEWKPWEAASYDLFNQALRQAALTPPAAFARSAIENKHVTWGDLFREPGKYRGRVIPVKGRLKMLRRRDTPLPLQRDRIDAFYEGWVFTDTRGANPIVVNFVKLPADIEPGERVDYPVQFNGYFLMRYKYLTSEGKQTFRNTLLFIAPTLEIRESAAQAMPFAVSPGTILTAMIVLVGGTVLLVLALGWRFRRGDRRHEAQLMHLRGSLFADAQLPEERAEAERITAVRPEDSPRREN
jgi:hypothetical protein